MKKRLLLSLALVLVGGGALGMNKSVQIIIAKGLPGPIHVSIGKINKKLFIKGVCTWSESVAVSGDKPVFQRIYYSLKIFEDGKKEENGRYYSSDLPGKLMQYSAKDYMRNKVKNYLLEYVSKK